MSSTIYVIESLGQAIFICIRENGLNVLNQPEKFFSELKNLFPKDKKAVDIFSNILCQQKRARLKESFGKENGEEMIRQLSLDLVDSVGLDLKWAEKFRDEFTVAVKDYNNLELLNQQNRIRQKENGEQIIIPFDLESIADSMGLDRMWFKRLGDNLETVEKDYNHLVLAMKSNRNKNKAEGIDSEVPFLENIEKDRTNRGESMLSRGIGKN